MDAQGTPPTIPAAPTTMDAQGAAPLVVINPAL
jgi:hypothetical protein